MRKFTVFIFYAIHVNLHLACARDQQCADGQLDAQNSASIMQKIGLHERHAGVQGQARRAKGYGRCALDVAIVIDASGSICNFKSREQAKTEWPPNGVCPYWESMQNAMVRVVQQIAAMEGTRKSANIGVVTYAKTTKWHTSPSLNTGYDEIVNNIKSLDWFDLEERETRTWEGIQAAEAQLTKSGKPKSQRLTLVLTDGAPTKKGCPSNNGKTCTTDAANSLKNESRLVMIAIGRDEVLNKNGNLEHMKSLPSSPKDFYRAQEFADLTDSFIDSILDEVCCLKNTEATCAMGNLCFQNIRGNTSCNEGTTTCHCNEPDECVYWREMPLTRNGSWGVCRKSATDIRGEGNPVSFLVTIVQDIFSSYWTMLTNSR